MSRGASSARLPPEEEPEKIKKWRENQQQMIVEKGRFNSQKLTNTLFKNIILKSHSTQ